MPRLNIYDRLVKSEDDITGLTAYGIYRQCRADFISRKQLELGVQILPDEIIEEFGAMQTDYILSLYIKHAEKIVSKTAAIEHDKIKPELDQEYCAKYEQLVNLIKPASFWYGVAQSFIASFLFLMAGYVLLRMTGSWDTLINKLFS